MFYQTLTRLGVTAVSSMAEATHFIADKFVRTRNMLEAIALGKLVVTHLWIESCGQANCFIDEKNHILRDAKKEKEFGFSMPGSLACARQRPLLEVISISTFNHVLFLSIIPSLVFTMVSSTGSTSVDYTKYKAWESHHFELGQGSKGSSMFLLLIPYLHFLFLQFLGVALNFYFVRQHVYV